MGGRIQNLKPWPKGVSGNSAGRPKDDISVAIARAVFENSFEAIYRGATAQEGWCESLQVATRAADATPAAIQ